MASGIVMPVCAAATHPPAAGMHQAVRLQCYPRTPERRRLVPFIHLEPPLQSKEAQRDGTHSAQAVWMGRQLSTSLRAVPI